MPVDIKAAAKAGKCPDPQPFRAGGGPAAIRAAEGNDEAGKPKLRRFSGRAYTGVPMTPEGWWTPVVIDLAGVKSRQNRPALRQHDHEQIVGHTDSVMVTPGKDGGIDVEGPFSGEAEHTKTVVEPADNGFQWQLSVGANPVRTEFLEAGETTEVNGREMSGPLVISRETEIGEISFVPLGADGDTSATVSASKRKGNAAMFRAMLKAARLTNPILAAQYSDEEVEKMTEDEAKAALKEFMADDAPPAKAADDDDDDDDDVDEPSDTDADDEPPAKSSKSSKSSKAKKGGIRAEVRKGVRAAREAAAKEIERQDAIRSAILRHGVTHVEVEGRKVNLEAHAIKGGWSAEKAELHALRAGRPAANVGGPLVYVTSAPELNSAVIEAAVFDAARHQFKLEDDDFYLDDTPDLKGKLRRVPTHLQREAQGEMKARYTDQVRQAAHTIFRGRIAPKQIIHAAFSQWGHRHSLDLSGEHGVRDMLRSWDHYESPTLRGEGGSNISISNILSNVLNKFALQGYLFVEQVWREICAIRPVSDFKPTKSINLLGDVMYKQLGPSGELQHASLGDQAFANQANPFGRILTIPWTHIVNDDLGMLTGAPMKIGQGAGLALNDQIWTLWKNMAAGTVNGDDGNAFWRTTSSTSAAAKAAGTAYLPNKQSGAGSVFGDAGLKAAMSLFWNQIDPNGNPIGYDGMTPLLLHGPTLWRDVTAQAQAPAIVYGGATAALAPSANPWQGKFKPVMSRYVENANYGNTTTGWWLLFAPFALGVIEVCFLNGVDTPAVLQAGPDYQFDKLGISIRGSMPFGSNQQNFRGGTHSVGA